MGKSAEKMERLEARIPASVKRTIQRAARLEGQTLTDFLLQTATEAARRVIHEHEIIDLTQRDQEAFAEALLNPPAPSPALKKAAQHYKRGGPDR